VQRRVESFQGALPTDGVAEENREKIDDLVVPETPPRETHTLIDLGQDVLLAKMRSHQRDFAKPGWSRGNGLG